MINMIAINRERDRQLHDKSNTAGKETRETCRDGEIHSVHMCMCVEERVRRVRGWKSIR